MANVKATALAQFLDSDDNNVANEIKIGAVGTDAGDLGKAEDAPHASGDAGVMILAVRKDAAAALAGADGDYVPLIVDDEGKLWVKLDSDIQIGAVEIKNGTTDQRAVVDSSGRLYVGLTSWSVASGAIRQGAFASGAVAQGAVASGAIASGAIASGAVASGAIASGAVASGAVASGAVVDGAVVTLGATADAAASSSVAEDTTARTGIGLWKGIKNILILMNAKLAALGQAAMAASMPVVVASDQSAVKVKVDPIGVTVTPTITAGAYTANDVIGGIQTIAGAAAGNGLVTTLQTLVITDLAMQDADMVIWFFNQNPANGTYTDNIAYDIHDTDLAMCVGWVDVSSSDYKDATDNSMACLRNIGLDMIPVATSLFAIAQIKVGDTYAATSDLSFKYIFGKQ